MARLREFMVARGWWGREQEEHLHAECAAEIDTAVHDYETYVPLPASSMFDHLYATLPHAYDRQRRDVTATAAEASDG